MRRDIDALSGGRFDVAVVGGGIHGAWIALRAARAGCRLALLERADFGAATSANSLKILHGGLRYLQHLDIRRMRASTLARREHALWMPHLFEPLPCVMPLNGTGLRSPWLLGPALLANDCIAFDRNRGVDPHAHLPRGGLLSSRRCEEETGGLVKGQAGGALWWDGIARDTSRLVLEALHEAVTAGAVIANHAPVERILHSAGMVRGLAFTDAVTGHSHELQAARVVNAAGPWAAALAERSGLPTVAFPEAWTGALNLVLRRPLGHRCAVAISTSRASRDAAGRGARELFFVPWQGRTMVGTDYVPVESVEAVSSGPPPGAVADFMGLAAALAPGARITSDDLALVHWGLMPLERRGDVLPRRQPLILTDAAATGARGLVHVIGEKLTSAPHVSARVLAHLALAPTQRPKPPSGDDARQADDVPTEAGERLRLRYGCRWTQLLPASAAGPSAFTPVHPGAAVLQIELRHAVESEMAQGVREVMRRVGWWDAGHPGSKAMQACLAWGVRAAGWNPASAIGEVQSIEDWFRTNRTLA